MAYVRACHLVNDGFGRRAGAIATLEGTFHVSVVTQIDGSLRAYPVSTQAHYP